LRKASELENPQAMFDYSDHFRGGIGIERNPRESLF
jgi:hypothetical protein